MEGMTKKSKTLTWYWVAVPLIQRDQHAKPGLSGGALRATLSESSSLPSCTGVVGGPTPPPFFLERRGWMYTPPLPLPAIVAAASVLPPPTLAHIELSIPSDHPVLQVCAVCIYIYTFVCKYIRTLSRASVFVDAVTSCINNYIITHCTLHNVLIPM